VIGKHGGGYTAASSLPGILAWIAAGAKKYLEEG
jgi:hypothetical protein